MEAGESTRRPKRCGSAMEMERVGKIKRQSDDNSSVADAMACEGDVSGAGIDGLNETDSVAKDSSPVRITASAQAVSAFDFSELTKALCDEEAGTSKEPSDVIANDAHVEQQKTSLVEISKQLIFKEVLQKLNLKILDMGLVIESPHLYSAWVDIETPPSEPGGRNGRKTLYGHGSSTQSGAIDSVCAIGALHLRMFYDVVIKDFNYSRMRMLEGKVARQMRKTSLLQNSLDTERIKNEKMKEQSREFAKQIFLICKRFTDILPIRISAPPDTTAQAGGEAIVYDGQRPPVTRVEELAFALTKLLTNNTF